MSRILEGRVALVTGGSRGIGRSIASVLAADGAEVVLTSRRSEDARRVADAIRQEGGVARGVAFDLADREATARNIEELLGHYGTIPVLVNNAGITRDGLLLRQKDEDWDAVLETNLTAVFRLCRALMPSMIRARYGRIVNITSVVAGLGNPGQTNYGAAKAAVEGFTRSLAREVASRNVTVNCVAPGFIDTDMTRALDDKTRGRLIEQIPTRRLGLPDDVAAAVQFLAGPRAGYITGVTLNVNGGMLM